MEIYCTKDKCVFLCSVYQASEKNTIALISVEVYVYSNAYSAHTRNLFVYFSPYTNATIKNYLLL